MSIRDLKNLLANELSLQKEYHEFCIECIKRIYGEKANIVIASFEEDVETFSINRYLSGICYLDSLFIKKDE